MRLTSVVRDMACNVGSLKAGEDDAVRDHITEVVASVPVPVTVIVEAPLLPMPNSNGSGNRGDADAAYLKTATGSARASRRSTTWRFSASTSR